MLSTLSLFHCSPENVISNNRVSILKKKFYYKTLTCLRIEEKNICLNKQCSLSIYFLDVISKLFFRAICSLPFERWLGLWKWHSMFLYFQYLIHFSVYCRPIPDYRCTISKLVLDYLPGFHIEVVSLPPLEPLKEPKFGKELYYIGYYENKIFILCHKIASTIKKICLPYYSSNDFYSKFEDPLEVFLLPIERV